MCNQQSQVTRSRFSLVCRVLPTGILHKIPTLLICEFKFMSFLQTKENDNLEKQHTMT